MVGEFHTIDILVVTQKVLCIDIAQHRFRIEDFECGNQLRLRIEVNAQFFAVVSGSHGVLHHRAVEFLILRHFRGRRRLRGSQRDAHGISAQQPLRRVLGAPAEKAARCGRKRNASHALDADGLRCFALAELGQHFVPVLNEVSHLQVIVEGGAAIC